MKLRTFSVRGLATSYLEEGNPKGPILLCLHGFPDAPQSWDQQIEYFKSNFHIIVPFLRGVGPSEPSQSVNRYSEWSQSLDLLAVLNEVDSTRKKSIFVLSHDLGVVHAWSLVSLLGKRCKGLVVINGLSLAQMYRRLSDWRQHVRSWYIYLMQIPVLPELACRLMPKTVSRLAHGLGKLPNEGRPVLDWNEVLPHALNQYRAFARELPELGRKNHPRLQIPVLVLWGSGDKFLGCPTIKELEPFAANIEVRVLSAGHWLHREHPEANRYIDEFLTPLMRKRRLTGSVAA